MFSFKIRNCFGGKEPREKLVIKIKESESKSKFKVFTLLSEVFRFQLVIQAVA